MEKSHSFEKKSKSGILFSLVGFCMLSFQFLEPIVQSGFKRHCERAKLESRT